MANHEEKQYLELISDIIDNGSREESRNGITLTKFGVMMKYSLKDGILPLFTTKKVAWRVCFEELFWFIKGCTDNTVLQNKNVKIWNANGSREFLDSRNLHHYQENDLGPVYGFQWRHFNAVYTTCKSNYSDSGIDQLQQIINDLSNPETRSSRRHILTAWNPCQIDEMALPPCHMICQFHVRENKYLSCALKQCCKTRQQPQRSRARRRRNVAARAASFYMCRNRIKERQRKRENHLKRMRGERVEEEKNEEENEKDNDDEPQSSRGNQPTSSGSNPRKKTRRR